MIAFSRASRSRPLLSLPPPRTVPIVRIVPPEESRRLTPRSPSRKEEVHEAIRRDEQDDHDAHGKGWLANAPIAPSTALAKDDVRISMPHVGRRPSLEMLRIFLNANRTRPYNTVDRSSVWGSRPCAPAARLQLFLNRIPVPFGPSPSGLSAHRKHCVCAKRTHARVSWARWENVPAASRPRMRRTNPRPASRRCGFGRP